MSKIALNLPGFSGDTNVPNPPGLKFSGPEQTSLGYVVSSFLNLIFFVALFLAFCWFIWGAYEYMVAQGQKEALAAARNRIKWSIIGFAVLVMAFLVGQYAPGIFPFIRTFYAGNAPKIQDTPANGTNPVDTQFNQPDCQQGVGQC